MNRPRTRTAVALAVAPLLLGLAGCGASLDAQTYQERTAADATNTVVGTLAVRNARVQPPPVGGTVPQGGNAVVELTLTNDDKVADALVEASSAAAQQVVTVVDGKQAQVVIPPLGSTGNNVTLLLRGVKQALVPGTYVPLSLRFARAGALQLSVPVGLTGTTDRPIFTKGEEGQPALQGPAGGHPSGDPAAGGGNAPAGGGFQNDNTQGTGSG